MPYPRIQRQFNELFDAYNGKEANITLEHLANVFECTKRNARLIINKMDSLGWLSWHPEAGRGKLSTIVFIEDKTSVNHIEVMKHLNAGKLELALELLNFDQDALSLFIKNQFGIQNKNGARLFRHAFSRPIYPLRPDATQPASEQHLLRKISSGLVKFDNKTNSIVADLAYAWEMLSPTHWRFFIRPTVFLHDKTRLEITQMVTWLEQLTFQPLFAHISEISVDPESQQIDIKLSKADHYFTTALCSYHALFFLRKEETIISCGPYQIDKHNKQQLKLTLFPLYFGEKPLIDNEEIWIIPESISENAPNHLPASMANKKVLINGCYYLLLNQKKGWLKKNAATIQQLLSPIELLFLMDKNLSYQNNKLIPAYGLLPDYHFAPQRKIYGKHRQENSLSLTLSIVDNNSLHHLIANKIQALLLKANIHLNIILRDFQTHIQIHESDNIDLWLMEMETENKRSEALLSWIYEEGQLKKLMEKSDWIEIETEIDRWREGIGKFPSEYLIKKVLASTQIIPLFHEWR